MAGNFALTLRLIPARWQNQPAGILLKSGQLPGSKSIGLGDGTGAIWEFLNIREDPRVPGLPTAARRWISIHMARTIGIAHGPYQFE